MLKHIEKLKSSRTLLTVSTCMFWRLQAIRYSQFLVHSTVVNSRNSLRYILRVITSNVTNVNEISTALSAQAPFPALIFILSSHLRQYTKWYATSPAGLHAPEMRRIPALLVAYLRLPVHAIS